MRKKPFKRSQERQKSADPIVYCRDCQNSLKRIERNIKGEFFMCWCPHHRWAQFLNEPKKCNDYKPLTNEQRKQYSL